MRRAATAADKAANPVPKSTTVTGSGIGTGCGGCEDGVDVGMGVGFEASGVNVAVAPGGTVAVGPGTVGVDPGGTVAVGPGAVGVAPGAVGVGGGAVGVSAPSCAKTRLWLVKAGAKTRPRISKSTAKKANFEAFAQFILRFLLRLNSVKNPMICDVTDEGKCTGRYIRYE